MMLAQEGMRGLRMCPMGQTEKALAQRVSLRTDAPR